jgi:hypothetical protein
MTIRAYALMADENGRFPEAAAAYEAALLSDPTDLEATLNLAVLYWQATAHERQSPGRLSPQFLEQAQWRLAAILLHAGRRFAGRAEIRFWTNYVAAVESGRPLHPTVCRELLRERPDYFEPAFVVFSDSAGEEAEPEAMRLLAHYSEQPTARGRYVTAIIGAALSRQRWRRPRAANNPAIAPVSPKAPRPRLTSAPA